METKYQKMQIESYDFLLCMLSILEKRNIYLFHPNNFVSFLKICKRKNKKQELLQNFKIQKAEEFYYVEELDSAIAKLIHENILYMDASTITYTVHIKENISIQNLISKKDISPQLYQKIEDIVCAFLAFEKEIDSYAFIEEKRKEKQLSKVKNFYSNKN